METSGRGFGGTRQAIDGVLGGLTHTGSSLLGKHACNGGRRGQSSLDVVLLLVI